MINNLSTAVDKYLLELAEKQELTVDVLCQLVSVLPVDKRSSHDILYKVVQTLLKSGKAIFRRKNIVKSMFLFVLPTRWLFIFWLSLKKTPGLSFAF